MVRRRRMVRNYDPVRPVPPELLERLLEYGIRAPSAGFSQGWHFLVVAEESDRALFWEVTTDPGGASSESDGWLRGMRTAPALIVTFSDKDTYLDRYAQEDKGWTDRDEARWPVPYWDIDTGMAALLILLGAVDAGLGACFFGVPPERHAALRAQFNVPERLTPVGVVSLGYPAPDTRSGSLRRGRRQLADVASIGRVGTPFDTAGPAR